ncbi:penicillin-binding protein 1A [Emticicia sp. 17c]|uniref:penicillin-binding protein 1A n=1 Tax=Emticicia sp. 17c TaxID=3127704 RepID=UPI00301C55F0
MKFSFPELAAGRYKKIISNIWKFTAYSTLLVVVYLLAVSFNLFWLFGKMPSPEEIENPKSDVASEIISADGKVIGKFLYENRSPIDFSELSPNIINALVATEDVRFTVHSGIDARSTLRVITGLFSGQRKGGGSTISQQLAKNLFKMRESDYYQGPLYNIPGIKQIIIKTKEWITAIKLERRYTKQEIMEKYLNTIEFSSGAFGIRSATKTYFKKEPSEVTLEEAAVLVGMIQNPSRFNPKFHPEAAKNRRNIVFDQMVKYDKLSPASAEALKKAPITLNYQPESHNTGLAPYFREFLKGWLKEQIVKEGYEPDDIYTKGFKIYTTIDSRMQFYAEEALKENMKDQQKKFNEHWKGRNPWVLESKDREGVYKEIPNFIENIAKTTPRFKELKEAYDGDLDKVWKEMNKPGKMRVFTWSGERDTVMSSMDSIRYYKRFLHSSFLAMDPRNGQIKAWVGGINYKYFKYDHVKQGKRQPGSTFKPFVYVTAIDNGFSTCEHVVDQPITISVPGGSWTPKNSDGVYSYKSLTLRQALGQSVNTVSAFLINQFKAGNVINYAHKLGIRSELDEVPALCLGISNVSLYELMAGYCVFANSGKYTEPIFVTRIEDKNGELIKEYYSDSKEVISQETAYKMIHLMRGATLPGGTAFGGLSRYGVLDGNEIAAKTGTTSNYSDGWFMGITPTLVAGGWTGGDDPTIHFRSIALGQGARVSLPTWGLFFQKVYGDKTIEYKKGSFLKPSTVSVSGDCVFAAGEGYHIDSLQKYTPPTAKPADDDQL